jgi:membrane dipeptidase
VIVDLSHISERAFWDTAEIAQKPVIAGHSNSASVFPHARNLTDDQFRFLVRCGGVAGINLYAGFLAHDAGIDDVVRHIEHFMSLDGEKTVALGGDFDGCDTLPRGINGIQDIPRLYETLLRLGYPEQVVKDIFYNNMMRVVQTVCVT